MTEPAFPGLLGVHKRYTHPKTTVVIVFETDREQYLFDSVSLLTQRIPFATNINHNPLFQKYSKFHTNDSQVSSNNKDTTDKTAVTPRTQQFPSFFTSNPASSLSTSDGFDFTHFTTMCTNQLSLVDSFSPQIITSPFYKSVQTGKLTIKSEIGINITFDNDVLYDITIPSTLPMPFSYHQEYTNNKLELSQFPHTLNSPYSSSVHSIASLVSPSLLSPHIQRTNLIDTINHSTLTSLANFSCFSSSIPSKEHIDIQYKSTVSKSIVSQLLGAYPLSYLQSKINNFNSTPQTQLQTKSFPCTTIHDFINIDSDNKQSITTASTHPVTTPTCASISPLNITHELLNSCIDSSNNFYKLNESEPHTDDATEISPDNPFKPLIAMKKQSDQRKAEQNTSSTQLQERSGKRQSFKSLEINLRDDTHDDYDHTVPQTPHQQQQPLQQQQHMGQLPVSWVGAGDMTDLPKHPKSFFPDPYKNLRHMVFSNSPDIVNHINLTSSPLHLPGINSTLHCNTDSQVLLADDVTKTNAQTDAPPPHTSLIDANNPTKLFPSCITLPNNSLSIKENTTGLTHGNLFPFEIMHILTLLLKNAATSSQEHLSIPSPKIIQETKISEELKYEQLALLDLFQLQLLGLIYSAFECSMESNTPNTSTFNKNKIENSEKGEKINNTQEKNDDKSEEEKTTLTSSYMNISSSDSSSSQPSPIVAKKQFEFSPQTPETSWLAGNNKTADDDGAAATPNVLVLHFNLQKHAIQHILGVCNTQNTPNTPNTPNIPNIPDDQNATTVPDLFIDVILNHIVSVCRNFYSQQALEDSLQGLEYEHQLEFYASFITVRYSQNTTKSKSCKKQCSCLSNKPVSSFGINKYGIAYSDLSLIDQDIVKFVEKYHILPPGTFQPHFSASNLLPQFSPQRINTLASILYTKENADLPVLTTSTSPPYSLKSLNQIITSVPSKDTSSIFSSLYYNNNIRPRLSTLNKFFTNSNLSRSQKIATHATQSTIPKHITCNEPTDVKISWLNKYITQLNANITSSRFHRKDVIYISILNTLLIPQYTPVSPPFLNTNRMLVDINPAAQKISQLNAASDFTPISTDLYTSTSTPIPHHDPVGANVPLPKLINSTSLFASIENRLKSKNKIIKTIPIINAHEDFMPLVTFDGTPTSAEQVIMDNIQINHDMNEVTTNQHFSYPLFDTSNSQPTPYTSPGHYTSNDTPFSHSALTQKIPSSTSNNTESKFHQIHQNNTDFHHNILSQNVITHPLTATPPHLVTPYITPLYNPTLTSERPIVFTPATHHDDLVHVNTPSQSCDFIQGTRVHLRNSFYHHSEVNTPLYFNPFVVPSSQSSIPSTSSLSTDLSSSKLSQPINTASLFHHLTTQQLLFRKHHHLSTISHLQSHSYPYPSTIPHAIPSSLLHLNNDTPIVLQPQQILPYIQPRQHITILLASSFHPNSVRPGLQYTEIHRLREEMMHNIQHQDEWNAMLAQHTHTATSISHSTMPPPLPHAHSTSSSSLYFPHAHDLQDLQDGKNDELGEHATISPHHSPTIFRAHSSTTFNPSASSHLSILTATGKRRILHTSEATATSEIPKLVTTLHSPEQLALINICGDIDTNNNLSNSNNNTLCNSISIPAPTIPATIMPELTKTPSISNSNDDCHCYHCDCQDTDDNDIDHMINTFYQQVVYHNGYILLSDGAINIHQLLPHISYKIGQASKYGA